MIGGGKPTPDLDPAASIFKLVLGAPAEQGSPEILILFWPGAQAG